MTHARIGLKMREAEFTIIRLHDARAHAYWYRKSYKLDSSFVLRVIVRVVRYTLGLCLLLASGCTTATPMSTQAITPSFVNYRSLDLVGQPASSKLTTCGQTLGRPWPCKILVYGSDAGNSLFVFLRLADPESKWVVASWNA
jgi:hypothetical protein